MSFNKRKLFQKIKQLYPKIQVQSKDFKDAAEEAFFTLLRTDNENAACQEKTDEFLSDFVKVVRRFWKERNVHSHMDVMFKNHTLYFDKPIDTSKYLLDIATCSLCQMTFPSHEEILVHTCEEIKEEKIEEIIEHSEIVANEQLDSFVQDDFKHESSSSCLDLSEEFLVSILKQVNDLCENIKSGDPDIERTIEVNQNLNNAVTFYRSKLDLKKHILIDTDQNIDTRVESDDGNEEICVVNDSKAQEEIQKKLKSPSRKIVKRVNIKAASGAKENLRKPKVPKRRFKSERHSKRSNGEKFELVKNQCGRHQVSSMAFMLDMAISTLRNRIRKEGIIFQKRQMEYAWECQFCEMEKNTAVAKKDDLLPLLKFNQNEEKFQCSICNFLFSERQALYNHLRSIHKNEINTKSIMNTKSEGNQECDGSVCKKLYGKEGKGTKFWCKKCSKELQLAKEMRKESKAGVCPECGLLANNLSAHRKDSHYTEKQTCSICSLEFRNLGRLHEHKKIHDKIPCTECGKLFGTNRIKRHMQSAHTPDDQKKYRCDTCGKGFIENQRLSDHINVHTGEKPYKCKFCSSCFASNGTHALHERGHLKRGLKLKK